MAQKQSYHFIGICGTAMGAVASALSKNGHLVTGSDSGVYPPMSTFLESRNIELHEGYRPENIPQDNAVIVVGNAISRGNPELESVLDRRLRYVSLPEVMKETLLRGRRNIVITGTHGKTTTTSLTAWLLQSAGRNPNYMIGGIPKNFGQGAHFGESDWVVLEGDEYDTAFFDKRSKFIHYLPEVVVVNNIEFDHADIYKDIDAIKLTFQRLLQIIPRNGALFMNGDDANCREIAKTSPIPATFVGLGEDCDARIEILPSEAGKSTFTFGSTTFQLPMEGEFNVRNACMAIASARHAGLTEEEILKGIASFEGVARRQEVKGEVHGIRVIDDFGHHPTAIRETLRGMEHQYPSARLWAIFEPRSNTSRRNVLQGELAESLSRAHGALVASVDNPGKVPVEDRMDPDWVVRRVNELGGQAWFEPNVEAIIERLMSLVETGDVIIVFSNGGFGGIHEKLLTSLAALKPA